MVAIGYTAMCEQTPVKQLVSNLADADGRWEATEAVAGPELARCLLGYGPPAAAD
jgi:hypothetical protein